MKVYRKMKTLTAAAAAGTLTAYLFDPQRGPQRRQHLTASVKRTVDQLSSATSQVADIRDTVGSAVSGGPGTAGAAGG